MAAEGENAPPLRTITLVRHGAYDIAEVGDEEVVRGLTPLGIAQARLAGARLCQNPDGFDRFVSSTFTRARQTAEVIGDSIRAVPVLEHDPLVCECLPTLFDPPVRPDANPTDMAAAEERVAAAFANYFVPAADRNRHDLLVCHGNVIRWLVAKALGVDTRAWARFSVAHCSITVVQVKAAGAFKILAVGDCGHIPLNLQSGHALAIPGLDLPPARSGR